MPSSVMHSGTSSVTTSSARKINPSMPRITSSCLIAWPRTTCPTLWSKTRASHERPRNSSSTLSTIICLRLSTIASRLHSRRTGTVSRKQRRSATFWTLSASFSPVWSSSPQNFQNGQRPTKSAVRAYLRHWRHKINKMVKMPHQRSAWRISDARAHWRQAVGGWPCDTARWSSVTCSLISMRPWITFAAGKCSWPSAARHREKPTVSSRYTNRSPGRSKVNARRWTEITRPSVTERQLRWRRMRSTPEGTWRHWSTHRRRRWRMVATRSRPVWSCRCTALINKRS